MFCITKIVKGEWGFRSRIYSNENPIHFLKIFTHFESERQNVYFFSGVCALGLWALGGPRRFGQCSETNNVCDPDDEEGREEDGDDEEDGDEPHK